MEIGSGIALGTLCVSAGAVCITAIRARKSEDTEHSNGNLLHPLCHEHSGVKACLDSIQDTGERHEKWLGEISKDIKELLREKN
jgi:hypothetical protein